MKPPGHPMQPVILDEQGIARFKPNAIVRWLLDTAQLKGFADMNVIAVTPFDREDREQFAQLIGYSVSGAGDLSYVSDELFTRADDAVAKLRAQVPELPRARKAPGAKCLIGTMNPSTHDPFACTCGKGCQQKTK